MKRKASAPEAAATELPIENALSVLRTETALSRFPLHQLTKDKPIRIAVENSGSAMLWRVDYSSGYGPPGALAYKIDSLFVNRRIEESGRPVPKIIRLGSLREIGQDLGLSTNTNMVKQALLQNASAFITAKLSYRTQDGGEKWLQAAFNRYSVVFTGELLPQGHTADGVHLVLNDIYQQILNTAIFRPLDYDYMKVLPPIAQRFYEIVSYQIYAALRYDNPRAKLIYSDYCMLSTATRYFDFDHVKKQMYKVVRPHMQSGYIAKVEYESTINERDEQDWIMYFTPGVNADREYRSFVGLSKVRRPRKETDDSPTLPLMSEFMDQPQLPMFADDGMDAEMEPEFELEANGAQQDMAVQEPSLVAQQGSASRERLELIEQLVEADLNRADAERFAVQRPEVCRRQLEYLAYVREFKSSRGAYLRRAIEGDFAAPAQYEQEKAKASSKMASKRRQEQERAEARSQKAREGHQDRFCGAYFAYVRQRVALASQELPEAFTAFKTQEAMQRHALATGPFAGRPLNQKALAVFDQDQSRLERCRNFLRQQGFVVLSFWEWDEQLNPERFVLSLP